MVLKPSQSNAASAAPARAHLVGGQAHGASAAVAAAAMPWSPCRRPVFDPHLLLGPPPPVGRRQRQHGDVDVCCEVGGMWAGQVETEMIRTLLNHY